jgi:hypothetical protein
MSNGRTASASHSSTRTGRSFQRCASPVFAGHPSTQAELFRADTESSPVGGRAGLAIMQADGDPQQRSNLIGHPLPHPNRFKPRPIIASSHPASALPNHRAGTAGHARRAREAPNSWRTAGLRQDHEAGRSP